MRRHGVWVLHWTAPLIANVCAILLDAGDLDLLQVLEKIFSNFFGYRDKTYRTYRTNGTDLGGVLDSRALGRRREIMNYEL